MRFNPTDALNHNPDDDTGDDGDFIDLIDDYDPEFFETLDDDYYDQMYLDWEAEREEAQAAEDERQRLY
jgi:hypothetical protein